MSKLFKLGILLIFVSMGLWVYKVEFQQPLPFTQNLDTIALYAGIFCFAIFFILYGMGLLSGTTWRLMHKNRCVRCGKKIPKGEVYCEFHKQETTQEFLLHKQERAERRR